MIALAESVREVLAAAIEQRAVWGRRHAISFRTQRAELEGWPSEHPKFFDTALEDAYRIHAVERLDATHDVGHAFNYPIGDMRRQLMLPHRMSGMMRLRVLRIGLVVADRFEALPQGRRPAHLTVEFLHGEWLASIAAAVRA